MHSTRSYIKSQAIPRAVKLSAPPQPRVKRRPFSLFGNARPAVKFVPSKKAQMKPIPAKKYVSSGKGVMNGKGKPQKPLKK